MNALDQWIADDIASGRRAERFAKQADTLERLLPRSARDASGNTIGTLVDEMRRVAAKGTNQ